MTTIAAKVQRLKSRVPELIAPDLVAGLLEKIPSTFRKRLLTPLVVIQLLVLRILEGNTAYSHLPHLSGISFTPSAFCQALARLPLELLQGLLASTGAAVEQTVAEPWLAGHRVLVADALCVSMPDTPELAEHFAYPAGQKPGLGFPLAKLLLLLDLSTGLFQRVLINPYRTHEASQARKLHPELRAGDILMGDRAFCSFVHLALLLAQGFHGLFRAHQQLSWNFAGKVKYRGHNLQARIVKSLGRDDRLVVYRKPKARPGWMSDADYEALPPEIVVRELRYCVTQKGFRSRRIMLVTTLLDPLKYPRSELARLYGQRWQIETRFRHLKSTLNMAILKGQSVAIVEREILAYVLVYNLLAREIQRAAERQEIAPDRVSFIDAVRWFCAGMLPGFPLRTF